MRRFLATALSVTLLSSFTTIAFANTPENVIQIPEYETGEVVRVPVGDAEYVETFDGEIIPISDLMEFDTSEEAEQYFRNLVQSAETVHYTYTPDELISPLSVSDTVKVSTKTAGMGAKINLYVHYEATGRTPNDEITEHSAFTTFTGATLGLGWEERFADTRLSDSGKDIYAEAVGEISGEFLVDGIVEFYSEDVEITGTCWVLR